jgi:hypothetical protein
LTKAGMRPTRTRYSARDAANMLATSACIGKMARGEQIRKLSRKKPSQWLRTMERLERVSGWLSIPLAEELVQFATRS